jgi:drug/metabolite transporter (DMT)-like permease
MRGVVSGMLAAALFGASAPLAKLLLPGAGPLTLAALLYLGAGLALTGYRLVRQTTPEAALRAADAPLLAGIVVFGGVVGPVLMLVGLERLSALAGALLLNLEAPFTMLLAVVLFGEHLARSEALGAALIVAGAAAVGARPGELRADWPGTLAIAGACLSWAIDNNLTARLTLRDPVGVTRAKTLLAGATSAALALATGAALPPVRLVGPALVVGALSYGASLVLHMRALRALGAARQAAIFATAPFAGAILAIPLLGDLPTASDGLAAAAMVAGAALLLGARHSHVHVHEAVEHEHIHVHDDHHAHAHAGIDPAAPHSHRHRHEAIEHDHPHVSDAHHHHRHRPP